MLEFKNDTHLMKWLLNTQTGLKVLRESLPFIPDDMADELVVRNRPAYVLVRAYGDGWIEVYGPKHVRAKVLGLPATESAEQEIAIDEWVGVNVKLPCQQIDYPSNRRAVGYVPPFLGFGEFVNGLVERDSEMAFVRACNGAHK